VRGRKCSAMLLHRAPQPNMASTTYKHQTSHASISTAPPARSLTAPTLCTHQDSRFPQPPLPERPPETGETGESPVARWI
jgi:hypothetical protein